MYPGVKTVLVGFAAAGSAGNASASGLTEELTAAIGRAAAAREGAWLGVALSPACAPPQGVAEALPGPVRPAALTGKAGNKLEFPVEPQLPVLLTAERADCAVDVLSFKTRFPPCEAPSPELEAMAEPGSEG